MLELSWQIVYVSYEANIPIWVYLFQTDSYGPGEQGLPPHACSYPKRVYKP